MEAQIQKPLGINDMFNIAKKSCNVFPYSQLKFITKIEELFEQNSLTLDSEYPFDDNSCIIIYLTKESFGHWCILNRLFKNNKYIYSFLDSYGEILDDQLNHINEQFKKRSGQSSRYLTNILNRAVKNSNDQVRYNDVQMQVLGNKISTCGRYVALFLKYNKLTVEEFVKILEKLSKKFDIPLDILITIVTTN